MRARLPRWLLGAAATLFASIGYVWLTTPDVRRLRGDNPATTAFMTLRASEARRAGIPLRHIQRWVAYEHIAPSLKRAVLVTEDAGFFGHDGVDYEEIRVSLRQHWAAGTMPRGASTLTQQLAKNLYLSPSRNPYRKLAELFIARRLEAELSKRRIFEIYLNVIEWGDGIWGADAAARTYFGASASTLSAEQSALLAGAIINARIYSPAHPNARLLGRQRLILGRMGDVTPPPNLPSSAPAGRSGGTAPGDEQAPVRDYQVTGRSARRRMPLLVSRNGPSSQVRGPFRCLTGGRHDSGGQDDDGPRTSRDPGRHQRSQADGRGVPVACPADSVSVRARRGGKREGGIGHIRDAAPPPGCTARQAVRSSRQAMGCGL